ncbi:hypothetical protein L2K20_13460 [Mycobacterium sp. MBM]|nr:hypothetical protein [Mycobacterium sp. MBM]
MKYVVVVLGALGVGASVWCAAPAAADGPVFVGTFLYTSDNGSTNTWTVTPCGAGCARVVSDSGRVDAQARLADGRWSFSFTQPDAWDCEDGTFEPGTAHVSFDAVTFAGTVSQGPDNVCGESDVVDDPFGFTLTQIG